MKKIPYLSFPHTHSRLRTEILQVFEAFYDKGYYILGPKSGNLKKPSNSSDIKKEISRGPSS